MLVIGDAVGVTWAPFTRCGIGIAHSHPYFDTGKTRNRHGRILLTTKEIADHPNLPAGIVSWNSLSANVGEGATEVSKIFPPASDIVFSGQKHLAAHSVYTPYAVLDNNGAKYIANPELNAPNFHAAPRLVFVIRNAALAADNVNYDCTLDATANG